MKEDEDLQKLIKDIPLKKSLAIKKHKQVQAHLNSLMELLKQVEVGLKDQLMKNDLHLAGIMSLDEKLAFAQENKDMTVAAVRETVNFQCDESLAEVANIAEYYELQKRIRIILNLRNSENQVIPTFSLFEDGFYSNWSTAENLSTTDRNLMLVSHLVFTILKRWKIALKVKLPPGSMFTAVSLSSIENRHSPPQLPTVTAPSTSSSVPSTTISPSVVEQSLNKPSNSNLAWGPAPTIRQRPFVPSLLSFGIRAASRRENEDSCSDLLCLVFACHRHQSRLLGVCICLFNRLHLYLPIPVLNQLRSETNRYIFSK